jgi:hypothetical protein
MAKTLINGLWQNLWIPLISPELWAVCVYDERQRRRECIHMLMGVDACFAIIAGLCFLILG